MFLFQETYYTRPGLQDVIDQRVRSLHENHATNPACAAMDWMKYSGDATTFLAFRTWHHKDVGFGPDQAAWMSEYNRTRPADAFVQPPDIDYFEQIDQCGESGGASFLVKCDLEVGGGSTWSTWESALNQLLVGDSQFGEYRLYRFMGGEHRHMRAEFWKSREAALAFWSQPEMRQLTASLTGMRRPPAFGFYDVLHQLGSAGPTATRID